MCLPPLTASSTFYLTHTLIHIHSHTYTHTHTHTHTQVHGGEYRGGEGGTYAHDFGASHGLHYLDLVWKAINAQDDTDKEEREIAKVRYHHDCYHYCNR